MSAHVSSSLRGVLADTWWYGLTQRCAEPAFAEMGALRAQQGFTAVQVVAGIPPEVGPENPNAYSAAGPAWFLDGRFNPAYLDLARARIQLLNELGLHVVVYGAWGHQIEWLGRERMAAWWLRLIDALDDLDVSYCLTGESNLWIGTARQLLPDKTTSSLVRNRLRRFRWGRRVASRVTRFLGMRRLAYAEARAKRREAWSYVLEELAGRTQRPLLVHPVPGETGHQAVCNPERLAADTLQTGHSERARNDLWQRPLAVRNAGAACLNLEPWYEGIFGQFDAEDQLYAYWVSRLAGTLGHCYGAHGLWNMGDGTFLAHYGTQHYEEALRLDTPRLLGLSHSVCAGTDLHDGEVSVWVRGQQLIAIGRRTEQRTVRFFPCLRRAGVVPAGRVWLPLEGAYAADLPSEGPAVEVVAHGVSR